jgi:DNA helicase-2/ATP-dependent DNA helicase PcrA
VVAGPGTGKTRTLAARLGARILGGSIRPEEALAIAFTNQAAAELRARLAAVLPAGAAGAPFVGTFHALALHLLDRYGGGAPRIADDAERLAVAAEALRGASPAEAKAFLERAGRAQAELDPVAALGGDPELAAAFAAYEGLLAGRGATDLDGLLRRALDLLGGAGVRAAVAGRWRSVSVDEYQDVSDVQAELVARLAPEGRDLFAIGDPDQAIYGFRGARPGHFARFAERYPGAIRVPLDTTYRLTGAVHAVARSVLPSAPRLAVRAAGTPVEVIACATPAVEATQIAARIERLVGGTSHFAVDSGRGRDAELGDVGFGDMAVLTRTKAQRREILEALARTGVPCAAVGEDEPHDPRSQKVAAMTMHASKGREFDVVFVAGVERELLPLGIAGFDTDPEEERRLLYVALTRARRHAIVTYSRARTLFGRRLEGGPSPVLAGLPDAACARAEARLPDGPARRQLELF